MEITKNKGMKRVILILSMVMALIVPMSAQQKGDKGKDEMRKEMRDFKIKFISKAMELNGETAVKFSEVYGRMDAEKHKLFRETRQLQRKVKNSKDATEADYEAATKALTEAKAKDAEIEKKYDAEFATFLNSKQIYKMKAAEGEFMERMHKMRKKR